MMSQEVYLTEIHSFSMHYIYIGILLVPEICNVSHFPQK